ncbi:hypothetical protein BCF44_106516 [Kutzneria buriramensis]|uniref:Uncharacterized protein n=2 Tax=Kutzneria buriramensis TaxID=1045776 RepID=A0A3E0HLP0_9PSEU|nr:hypothetical protein BCF44_106516 [Kutzneria buriramensis]
MTTGGLLLCPERDGLAFREAVSRGLTGAKRNVHRGRGCAGRERDCAVCADLVSAVYVDVLARYRRLRPTGWAPGYVAAVAGNTYRDSVRARLRQAGLVARPERWLAAASFLPDVPAAGRALVVCTVLAVGYHSVLPVAGHRIVVDDVWLERMLDGLRAVAHRGPLAAVRGYWSYDACRDPFVLVRAWCREGLESWRLTQPRRYVALLLLNEANAQDWPASADDPALARRLGGEHTGRHWDQHRCVVSRAGRRWSGRVTRWRAGSPGGLGQRSSSSPRPRQFRLLMPGHDGHRVRDGHAVQRRAG